MRKLYYKYFFCKRVFFIKQLSHIASKLVSFGLLKEFINFLKIKHHFGRANLEV